MSASAASAAAAVAPPGGAAAAASERKYRFYRSDFAPLESRPLHLDLYFDIIESRVIVTNHTTFVYVPAAGSEGAGEGAGGGLRTVRLNSSDLDISSVERVTDFLPLTLPSASSPGNFTAHVASFASASSLQHRLDSEAGLLSVELDEAVQAGAQFVLRIVSIATPTDNVLEGLYYDFTEPGCPRTIITQCQQYGFQRITPCMDYMTAKAYYTTTITADCRYTNAISNGDLAPGYSTPAGVPVGHPPARLAPADVAALGIERQSFRYHNHLTNMAPYLFFLGVGTYSTYRRQLEYPDGDCIALELLCLPSLVRPEDAEAAVRSLHDSVMWVYLSTGPEAHLHDAERQHLYDLIKKREELKAAGQQDERELAAVRAECLRLVSCWGKTGYKYTGAVYREISMLNSDYGGMENVGNTTILASRIVASRLQSDAGYIYMEGVKVHEYYHNINGSEVTGESPFEIWLNEAVTVHIQNQREAALFGADFMRLKTVVYSFMPAQGPLAMDRSAISMAIEPEGFNRTQELITAMTYSKAPEFIRMVELSIGTAAFNVGLDHYHTKHRYANASTRDWISAMEWASGQQLQPMADGWLRRTGYPDVVYSTSYDAHNRSFSVRIQQSAAADGSGWEFPVSWALVKDGKNVQEGLWRVDQLDSSFTVEDVASEPDFLSFARGWSFFGTSKHAQPSLDRLRLQALSDPDVVNRYFAYRAYADHSKAAIIEAFVAHRQAEAQVSPDFVQLHARLLFDSSISPSTRAQLLTEAEDIASRPELGHHYWEIYYAKQALLQAVYDAEAERIFAAYEQLERDNVPGPHLHGIHDRALKAHLFRLIAAGNAPSVLPSRTRSAVGSSADVVRYAQRLSTSHFMTDQTFGIHQFLSGPASSDQKRSLQADVLARFSQHPDTVESYIGIVAAVDSDEAVALIRELVNNASLFNYALAGHARSLARAWGGNRKRALLTDDGLELTVHLFLCIGTVNQMSAQSLLRAFSDVGKMDSGKQRKLSAALQAMRDGLDAKKQQSLVNQLKQIISSVAPAATHSHTAA